ncbi:MAG TPA: phage tail sheath C-terminal domain-containing protein [Pyrinomonadaceae bacterium]
MPEYLAPGVYVEEIDTGTKPIEGVSTSTAGMLGVTERGPVNVPILITSYGEYIRWFGERLNIQDYSNASDPHVYLPQGVEGFFLNGGKRVYVTRVLDVEGAARASFDLHDRGTSASNETVLLLPASEGDGTAASPLYVLDQTGLTAGTPPSRIRIGSGSEAEYRTLGAAPSAANHVAFDLPLSHGYASGVTVDDINIVNGPAPNAFTLFEAAEAGDASIVITASALGDVAVNNLLSIGTQLNSELRFVRNVQQIDPTPHLRITLDSALMLSYAASTGVNKLDPQPGGTDQINNNTLAAPARVGDSIVRLTPPRNDFSDRGQLVIFDVSNNDTRQARRIGSLHQLSLTVGSNKPYPATAIVEAVTLTDNDTVATRALDADVTAGSNIIRLNNRVDLKKGSLLRIGVGPEQEFVTISSSTSALPNPSPGDAPPNAGNVVLSDPVGESHAKGTIVRLQATPLNLTNRPSTSLVLDAEQGARSLIVADGGTPPAATGYGSGEVIRVRAGGEASYHVLESAADPLDARPVELNEPLRLAHAAGSPVAERESLLNVQALDAGAWGDRLRISVEDEESGLVARTPLAFIGGPTQIRLASTAGVERGTILELINPLTGAPEGDLLKVANLERSTGNITLQGGGLSSAQQNAISSAPPITDWLIRSRELRLTVYLLRQSDPATPTRNTSVLDIEAFRNLSMDSRHSRYVQNIVGTTFSAVPGTTVDDDQKPLRLSDRRSEGESLYVRVRDAAQSLTEPDRTTTLESVRLGPEALVDVLPDGRRRAARHPLAGGNDSISTLADAMYIGSDSNTPEERTGLQSLRNVEDISIIACPGRTGPQIQNALITHCELMRYRFAVLDGLRPPNDALANIQTQRQQYDTKYAALYHPWLLVPDPFPANLSRVADYPLPPSGHVVGIYARTDIERGVHKAPANEVVRGITGLQRTLNKGEQDILNPFPVNINVIRDFRTNNRGIRVFGGRVITSDPDWKYVNVRRLLIFIEASIDRGLQWVVFEPNAEPLWARVRRSISNFLTQVWRDGALEGTKVEEAYFVKCDRTTMTQTDIDNGRLIVIVGVAPVKPAEFVIIRIGLFTAHADN